MPIDRCLFVKIVSWVKVFVFKCQEQLFENWLINREKI